jgi:hypothetical protein
MATTMAREASLPRVADAAETTRRFRAAFMSADLDALIDTMAPDVELRSPITLGYRFRGREELRELMLDVLAVVRDTTYFEEVGDERVRALFGRSRVGAQAIEEAVLLRFDADGRVRELTLHVRPLPGLAALAAELAPRIMRRRHGQPGAAAGALMRPLVPVTRLGDRAAVRLLRR